MKRLLIGALIALGLLVPGPARAATMLTDAELVGVSGGGIDPHLGGQSLPQDQQLPGTNSSGYTPPQQLPTNDGMDLAPELFAVLQSRIDVQRERKVLLGGKTQQNALTFNLENLLSSDTVSTNNIFDGSTLALANAPAEVEINQVNRLDQLHRTQGSLTSSLVGLRYETTVESRSGSESYLYYTYSLVDRQIQSDQIRTDAGSSNVSVGVGNNANSLVQLSAGTLPISIIPATGYGPYFDIPPVGGTLDAGWFGKYGAEVDYSGATLTGVGLSLNSIGTRSNDLVLGTSLSLPNVDFGNLEIKGCVGVCAETNFPLGSVGGQTFSSNIVIPDLGPRIDELNLSSGFAVIGSGEINLGPASFHVGGDATVKVTPYANLTLDLSKVNLLGVDVGKVVKDILGQNKWPERPEPLSFDLINLHVPLTLVDLNAGSFASRVDGGIFYGDNATGDTNHSATETLDQDNNSIRASNTINVAESSFSESYEHSVFTGGRMTGAEAELLALSDGTLSVSNNNNVTLTDGAQQNMRVLNGVNASSSVAANALNMSSLAAFRARPIPGSRTALTQQNRFNQQK